MRDEAPLPADAPDPGACRLLLIGGFLGAGKTSLLLAAAARLRARGRRVALLTNDQGHGLVDSEAAAAAGWPVAEVAGGCFCCRFDALRAAVDDLRGRVAPDAILAEPVGSCTDLQATVVNPLRRGTAGAVRVLPLTVAVEPERLRGLLGGATTPPGADDAVGYLAERQLAEADVLLLNKVDLLGASEAVHLTGELRALHPGARVLPTCAATGAGVDAWLAALWEGSPSGKALDLDYGRYAAAEAALAWLNAAGEVAAADPLSAGTFAAEFLEALRAEVAPAGGRIAHLKCAVRPAEGEVGAAFAHVTSGAGPAACWPASAGPAARRLRWRLNARVRMAPDALWAAARRALDAVCQAHGAVAAWDEVEHFRPARPSPTHRMEA